jgi:hypothetical protein
MSTRFDIILRAVLVIFLAVFGACSESSSGDGDGGSGDGTNGSGDGTSGDAPVCGYIDVQLGKTIPTVILLIDGSSSMPTTFGDTTRWDAVYETLMSTAAAPDTGVVKRLEGSVRFGLTIYTSYEKASSCPMLTEVAPELNNHAAIDAVYGAPGAEPPPDSVPKADWHQTPTSESLEKVHEALAAMGGNEPKVIVLATDGLPDTCANPNVETSGTGDEKRAVEDLVVSEAGKAYDDGIRTFVIGVDLAKARDHLQEVANAGVGLDPEGDDKAPYYVAENEQDLVDAFQAIIGSVTDCLLELETPLTGMDSEKSGVVKLDGEPASHGTDWRMVDVNTLEILGAKCQALLAGEITKVSASWPCEDILY